MRVNKKGRDVPELLPVRYNVTAPNFKIQTLIYAEMILKILWDLWDTPWSKA